MVAACSANPTPDVSLASDVGSLVFAISQITDPRWRLDALVRIVPSLRRIGAPIDWVRTRVRRETAGALCPAPLRERMITALDDGLMHASAEALAQMVTALWSPGWIAASMGGIGAALAIGDREAARQLALYHWVVESPVRGHRARFDDFVRRGYIAAAGGKREYPQLVANVDVRRSEDAYAPSLPVLVGVVDAILRTDDEERIHDAEAMLVRLRPHERPIAKAHLARLAMRFGGVAAGRARVRSIRERGIRDGAVLFSMREAIAMRQLDVAEELAREIDGAWLKQWAQIELAHAYFAADRIVDALRTSQRVDEPSLLAEQLLLLEEIRLVVRRDRETPAGVHRGLKLARGPAAWLRTASWIDADAREDIFRVLMPLRLGMRSERDRMLVGHAAWNLGRAPHRSRFLDIADRAGVDVDRALLEMHGASDRHSFDALLAARVAQRASRLTGTYVAPQPVADGRSLERATFDEQLSLTPTRRRRVLITTARACLRSALLHPEQWCSDAIAARLRTLVQLGGTLARDAIVKALRTLPIREPAATQAIEALCCLDTDAARDFVLERFAELTDVRRLLLLVERHRAVPRGFAEAFMRARKDKGDAWLARFLELVGTVPSVAMLDSAANVPCFKSADELWTRISSSMEAVLGGTHAAVAARLAANREVLGHLLVRHAPHTTSSWTLDLWQSHLKQASTFRNFDAAIRHKYRRIIRRPPLFVATTNFVVNNVSYRVRLLDKQRDILVYLRFADGPVHSCYRTDYVPTRTITAWLDPLSFCFHIERSTSAGFRPCGFLFGHFAEVESKPAVVMNGLHVRPRTAAVREEVLRAVETSLCEPLGIRHIAIANCHGGRGPLPANYVRRTVTFTRYRALTNPPAVLDDISPIVNAPVTVDHLYWRTQPEPDEQNSPDPQARPRVCTA